MNDLKKYLKILIKRIVFFLNSKRINIEDSDVITINISRNELSVFSLSTNPIISFKIGGNIYFFRECPQIFCKHEFFDRAIVRFFDFIDLQKVDKQIFKQKIPIRISFSKNEVDEFKEYISAIGTSSFYEKLAQADKIADRVSFNIWTKQEYDGVFFSKFGMMQLPEHLFDIAILFIWNMRSSAILFHNLTVSRFDKYSFFNAAKTISSKIVAEEFGVPKLLVDAKIVYLMLDDNTKLLGVLTPKACGDRACDMIVDPDPSLQKELHDLFVLDNLCWQTDHGPDNYNIYRDNGTCHICAFDNDNPYTFLPIPYVNTNISGCSSFIDNNGKMKDSYISGQLLNGLEHVNLTTLKKRLKPYLNHLQVQALIHRVKIVKKSIMRAREDHELKAINDNECDKEILNNELSGAFGETYLTKLMKAVEN